MANNPEAQSYEEALHDELGFNCVVFSKDILTRKVKVGNYQAWRITVNAPQIMLGSWEIKGEGQRFCVAGSWGAV